MDSTEQDQVCRVYDITADGIKEKFALPGEEGKVFITGGRPQAISLSAKGTLAVVDSARGIRVWDISGPKPELRQTISDTFQSLIVHITSDGDRLIRANEMGFEVWTLKGGTFAKPAISPSGGSFDGMNLNAVCTTPDGNMIITGHINGAVLLWSVEKSVIIERNPLRGSPRIHPKADISPDGRFVAFYHEDQRIHLWNCAQMTFHPLTTRETTARFAPSGQFAFTNYAEPRTLRIVNPDSPTKSLHDFALEVYPLCYSPDGKWLVTENNDKSVIFDVSVSPPKELFTLQERLWPGTQFTPDGRFLISGISKHTSLVKVFAVTPRGLVLRHELTIPSYHFTLSPDGKTLVSCYHDGVKYYDLKDGVLTLRKTEQLGAWWTDYSPDGKLQLITRYTLQLRDAETGKVLRDWPLRGKTQYGRFHPDGKHIIVTNCDSTTYILRLPKDVLDKFAPKPVAKAIDDRETAKFVLQVGGRVRARTATETVPVFKLEELPAGPLAVTYLELTDKDLSDDGWQKLAGLRALKEIIINGPTFTDDIAAKFDCPEVEELRITGTKVGDRGLVALAAGKKVRRANVGLTPVGDEGVKALAACPDLIDLTLTKTAITNDGLAHLAGAKKLIWLHLNDTAITDAGLKHLEGLQALRQLSVKNTSVTEPALKALKLKLHPDCQIDWDKGTVKP